MTFAQPSTNDYSQQKHYERATGGRPQYAHDFGDFGHGPSALRPDIEVTRLEDVQACRNCDSRCVEFYFVEPDGSAGTLSVPFESLPLLAAKMRELFEMWSPEPGPRNCREDVSV